MVNPQKIMALAIKNRLGESIVTVGNISIAYPLVSYYLLKDLLTSPAINKHPKNNYLKDKTRPFALDAIQLFIMLILISSLTLLPSK